MVGDPPDPESIPFKLHDLAQLRQPNAERRAWNLDREIAAGGEPAKLQGFTDCWIGYERPERLPVPNYRFPNFLQDRRQIGSLFILYAHPRGRVSNPVTEEQY